MNLFLRNFIVYCLSLAIFSLCSAHNAIELNDDNWKIIADGEWFILLYAPWCPACQSIKPTWKKFGESVNDIKVASIDISENPVSAGSFMVSRLPTIYYVKNGMYRQYTKERSVEAFKRFYQSDYKNIDPVAWYLKPTSCHMTCLGYLFKLSQYVMKLQQKMEVEYGWATWVTYVAIGGSVITMGLILSLIIVCVFDMFLPPRPQVKKYISNQNDRPNPYITKDTDPDVDTFPDKSETEPRYGGITDEGDNLNEQETCELGDDANQNVKKMQ